MYTSILRPYRTCYDINVHVNYCEIAIIVDGEP